MKIGLLPRILIAIVLGIVFGQFLNEELVRVFVTFNALFSQLLGFLIPYVWISNEDYVMCASHLSPQRDAF